MKDKLQGIGRQMAVSTEFALVIVVMSVGGFFAGNWVDEKLHCSPLGLMVGLFGGLTLAMVLIVRRTDQMAAKSKEASKKTDQ